MISSKSLKLLTHKISSFFDLSFDELTVSFVNAKEMKALNNQYRKKSSVTDVLTFRLDTPTLKVGEIVICKEEVKKSSTKRKISIKEEVSRLLVHGVAHLAGLTHDNKKNFSAMRQKEFDALIAIL